MQNQYTGTDAMRLVARNVRRHLPQLSASAKLYVSGEIVSAGAILGPEFQNTKATLDGILVFCDFHPDANFAHDCRYLLFNPESGVLQEQFDARFPPYTNGVPEDYSRLQFVGTEEFLLDSLSFSPPSIAAGQPEIRVFPNQPGRRRALLFSGKTAARHLNTLECCWRLLRAHQFAEDDIEIYNFDGSINALDWKRSTCNLLHAQYQMKVRGKGTAEEFLAATERIGQELAPDDLFFIFTTGHGDGSPSVGPYIASYKSPPAFDKLSARRLGEALQKRRPHRGLVVLMQQCSSGGFQPFILGDGTKGPVSFTAAAKPGSTSHGSDQSPPGVHELFAWNWFAALNGRYLDASDLLADGRFPGGPDTVKDVFRYASRVGVNILDDPQYEATNSSADDLEL